MRKQERDIQQKKMDRQRMKATLRCARNPQESDDEDSEDQNQKRRKITKTRCVATMKKQRMKSFQENKTRRKKAFYVSREIVGKRWKKKKKTLSVTTMLPSNMGILLTNSLSHCYECDSRYGGSR
jgi:hypothetical protein